MFSHQAWPSRLISAFLAFHPTSALSYQFQPEHNITCPGDSYDLTLPSDGDFNPNELTMQQLCAHPQLGGGLPYRHIGGFCRYDSRDNRDTRLVFDGTDSISELLSEFAGHSLLPSARVVASTVNSMLFNPRVMAACTYRCFCNFGVTDRSSQPKVLQYLAAPNPRLRWRADETYLMVVDQVIDFDPPWNDNKDWFDGVRVETPGIASPDYVGDLGSWSTRVYASSIAERDRTDTGRVNVVEVMSEEPGLSDSDNYAQSYTYVSMSPQNNIGCRGPLPPFPLLPPYLTTDFRDLQHMCAVAFSGGNPNANAGGYCHHSDNGPGNTVTGQVWFSDEFTPRLEWTWRNFLASGAVRLYCRNRCVCSDRNGRDGENLTSSFFRTRLTEVWQFAPGFVAQENKDGSITYGAAGAGDSGTSGTSIGQMLPHRDETGSASWKVWG